MNAADDMILLDRWRENRDGDAFAELARRHSPVVFDLTCRVVGDRGLAEDILQEALLDLAMARTREPVEIGVAAWLVRFSVCRARNRLAAERQRTRRQTLIAQERPEARVADDTVEQQDELERALRGCAAADRALLAMRFLHGWGYDRIATALSIQTGAARVRVHRVLQGVRAQLPAGHGGSERSRLVRACGALPRIPLSPPSLDQVIRNVLDRARTQPAPRDPRRRSSRPVRLVLLTAGPAMVLVCTVAVPGGSPPVAPDSPAPARQDVSRLDGANPDVVAASLVPTTPADVWHVLPRQQRPRLPRSSR